MAFVARKGFKLSKLNWNRLQLTLGPALHENCGPGWCLPRDWADQLTDFNLWFVWAGQGTMQLSDGTVGLRPGSCIWMRPGGIYIASQLGQEPLSICHQHFDLVDGRTRRRIAATEMPGEVFDVFDLHATQAILHRIRYLVQQVQEHPSATGSDSITQAANTLLRGLLMDMLSTSEACSRPQNHADHFHRSIILPLAAKLSTACQPAPTVAEMAAQLGYEPAHFSHLFREVTGSSPREFILAAKISRARLMLVETDLPVSGVASELGYSDVFFFSRQFKRFTGQAPSDFRKAQGTLARQLSATAPFGKTGPDPALPPAQHAGTEGIPRSPRARAVRKPRSAPPLPPHASRPRRRLA